MFPLEQGAFEMLLIGAIALMVVGPKDLPVLMRKVGQFTAKMRGLAAEFRASFEDMARQSELDDLRKEVEALRTGTYAAPAVAEIEQHLSDFNAYPSGYPSPAPEALPQPETLTSVESTPSPAPPSAPKTPRAKKAAVTSNTDVESKPRPPRKPKSAPTSEAEG